MKLKIQLYSKWHNTLEEKIVMPKTKMLSNREELFGDRLARLRKAAGYSQRELANETGVSHRMVAYYETQTEHPPTQILPRLSKALMVSTDQLLGVERIKANDKKHDTRLWRRFSQVEKLQPAERKPIFQMIDAFLKAKQAGG